MSSTPRQRGARTRATRPRCCRRPRTTSRRPSRAPNSSRRVRKSASAWRGMGAVGQQVDDRDVDDRRHLLERGVVEHPRRDHRAEAGEGAGDVGDRLAHPEADLLGPHVDRVTAEADHRHLGRRRGCGPTASRTAAPRPGPRAPAGCPTGRPSTSAAASSTAANSAGVEVVDLEEAAARSCGTARRAEHLREDRHRGVDLVVGHEQRRREPQRGRRDRVDDQPGVEARVGDRPGLDARRRARRR